jgi:hypothetical protein
MVWSVCRAVCFVDRWLVGCWLLLVQRLMSEMKKIILNLWFVL